MNIFDKILDSTLLGVLVGGIISILSVYIVEAVKSKKDKQTRRRLIFQDIKVITRLLYRYFVLSSQTDVFISFHKRMFELTKNKTHEVELQKRTQQNEEFKLKIIEIETDWNKTVAAYNAEIGSDPFFDKLSDEIDNYEFPDYPEYKNIDDIKELEQKYKKDDNSTFEEINKNFQPLCNNIVEYVRKKLC